MFNSDIPEVDTISFVGSVETSYCIESLDASVDKSESSLSKLNLRELTHYLFTLLIIAVDW